MEQQNQSKGTVQELIAVFKRPFQAFGNSIRKYFHTSILIMRFNRLPDQLNNPQDKYFSDVKYSFAAFEFLIIFILISKIIGLGTDLGELGDSIRDFLVLILYFLMVLLIIGVSRTWRSVFGIKAPSRSIDAFFIYEFNLLFLPSYLFMYPIYVSVDGDDDVIGAFGVLMSLFWLIHLIYFFIKMVRFLQVRGIKSFLSVLVLTITYYALLIVWVFFVIGASIGE